MNTNDNSKVPNIIYYCWFGDEKPQKVMDCINNWKEKLPDYNIIEINDKNKDLFDVEKECQNNLWFKTCYENKMWAYVADYARLKVLYERGGVYLDTDIILERDITELLKKNKLVLGWENDNGINVAVAITNSANKIVKQMLDFYSSEIWHSKLYTIPEIATYILRKNYILKPATEITENGEILILTPEYFYPVPYGSKEHPNFITNNTYTVHLWNASWLKPNIYYFLQNKHKKKLNKLVEKCFKEHVIINTPFLCVRRNFTVYDIKCDTSYLFRFKYKKTDKHKYLTVFILGVQILIWRIY